MDKKNVLIVDDSPENIKRLKIILEDKYNIKAAIDGLKAWNALEANSDISIILLDINMPVMNGYELCEKLKADPRFEEIPVIFITASQEEDDESKGFELGASDFITKPFSVTKVRARVDAHVSLHTQKIKLRETITELDEYKDNLESMVQEGLYEISQLNEEITSTQKEVILNFGSIAESRSKETGLHVKRVATYSYLLAKFYGLDEDDAQLLKMASPMHDIGKIGIPDNILHKAGKLDLQEWKTMQTHSELGFNMLNHSERPLFKAASVIAYEHHEKWDGSGYPRGLAGEDIHIYGRITALADVFDALGSDRCYKKAWEDEKIFNLFKDEKAKHFDPKLIDIFFDNLDSFLEVREKLKDKII